MTQDEIIDMARRAGFIDYELDDGTTNAFDKRYKAFAKLIAEKEREFYMQLFLDPENQPTQFGTATQEYREQEIRAEREAIWNILFEYAGRDDLTPEDESLLKHLADLIRARGHKGAVE